MSAESTLYSTLSGYAALTSLVSTRIYPDAMPEEVAYPAVVFSRAGTEPVVTIGGQMVGEFVSLHIECWAETRTSADAVASAVVAGLLASGEQHTGRSAGFDPEAGLYASMIDVTLLAT